MALGKMGGSGLAPLFVPCLPRRRAAGCMAATAISIEVVTLIFFSHSASSEAQILDTVSDEAQKLRLRP
jgi:hypothetical protein